MGLMRKRDRGVFHPITWLIVIALAILAAAAFGGCSETEKMYDASLQYAAGISESYIETTDYVVDRLERIEFNWYVMTISENGKSHVIYYQLFDVPEIGETIDFTRSELQDATQAFYRQFPNKEE